MEYKYNIMIVGCGGTGGNYCKELGRYISSIDTYKKDKIKITLIDGDVVEEKNIKRQPFLDQDIGKKKVEVMSIILREAFEVESSYYPEYINDCRDLEKIFANKGVPILIGAVDNHQCRRSMHEFFVKQDLCFYLDAANEYQVGEVVVGVRSGGMMLYPDRSYYFPEVLDENEKKRSEESCMDLNMSNPQHLVTNLFAANVLLAHTVALLEEGCRGGLYYFDISNIFCKKKEEVYE